ncbi:MAG: hypothetical protein QXE05_00020 [Nitrososphaeria archaeon]
MKKTVFAIILLTLVLVPFYDVRAASYSNYIVSCKYPNGWPAQNVIIKAYIGDMLVNEVMTDQNGMAMLTLPSNETVIISASLFGWQENKTITTRVSQGKIEFTVKVQATPLEKSTIPLKLTIWAPGGFTLYFEEADQVNATIKTLRMTSKYILTIKQGMIIFETNDTDTYILNAEISYKQPAWRTITLYTYSTAAMLRTSQSFPVYTAKVGLEGMVESIIGPHYPTPEEIAKAQMAQWQQLKAEIIREVVKEIRAETGNLRTQVSDVSNRSKDIYEQLKNLFNFSTKSSQTFQDILDNFQANAWSTMLLMVIVVFAITIGLYITVKEVREEHTTTITESGKIEKIESKPPQSKAKEGKRSKADIIIYVLIFLGLLWLMLTILGGGL